jgi:hypothetical protein
MSKPTNVPVVTALTPISAQNTATEIVNLRAHDCDGTMSVNGQFVVSAGGHLKVPTLRG